MPAAALAPQAAGVIHGDFEKGFIRAETIAYDDFVALGGEGPAKEAALLVVSRRQRHVGGLELGSVHTQLVGDSELSGRHVISD